MIMDAIRGADVEHHVPVSGSATAALWLGIAGLLTLCVGVGWILGVIALILGITAFNEINRSAGQLAGRGRAKAGAILGGVTTMLGVLIPIVGIFLAILIPQLTVVPASHQTTQLHAAETTSRMLQSQVELYRAMNGRYPQNLDDLVTEGLLPENPNDAQGPYKFEYDSKTGQVIFIPRQP